MSDRPGMTVRVSRSELLTGRLDVPLPKDDLDILRTYFAGRVDEGSTLARDCVIAFRRGQALAEKREARILDALLGDERGEP
jgi:hypothetical protein